MNNISILGRLTRDIVLQKTSNGVSLARFDVAVSRGYKNADGDVETDFFKCVAWRETAENIAKWFKKGNYIGLIGSMNSRAYEGEDGVNRTIWELNVKGFSFANSSSDKEEEPKKDNTKKTNKKKADDLILADDIDDDDLPF